MRILFLLTLVFGVLLTSCSEVPTYSGFLGNEVSRVERVGKLLTNISKEISGDSFVSFLNDKTSFDEFLLKLNEKYPKYDVHNWGDFYEVDHESIIFLYYVSKQYNPIKDDGSEFQVGTLRIWAESKGRPNLKEITLLAIELEFTR